MWVWLALSVVFTLFKTSIGQAIPRAFDAREEWPRCKDLIEFVYRDPVVRCQHSHVLATASAITDRVCIGSKGVIKNQLSAREPLECCSTCGGCFGGTQNSIWKFWVEYGLVTGGGPHTTEKGCKPYVTAFNPNPRVCRKTCEAGFQETYDRQKINNRGFVLYSFAIDYSLEDVQRDIMKYGPLVVGMTQYFSFFRYRGGGVVYTVPTNDPEDGVAGLGFVKLIGWNVTEGGVPYWIGTNSRGIQWGDRGLFRIRRGTNESNIESKTFQLQAARPQILRTPDFRVCQKTDLVFVIDGTKENARPMVRVIQNAIQFFDIPNIYQVGIVMASTVAETTLRLAEETDHQELISDVDDYVDNDLSQSENAYVNLTHGIQLAQRELTERARTETLRLMVIIINGTTVNETGVRQAARMAKQAGIWILVAAKNSAQRTLLSRIASSGQYRFINSGDLGEGVGEDELYFFTPLLIEENCLSTQLCWSCLFENGIYYQDISGRCDMYYHCRRAGDTNPHRRICPIGKFWDRDALACVWPTETVCWADPCVNQTLRNWPNQHYCGAHWVCQNTRTVGIRCCPRYQRWIPELQACRHDTTCNDRILCFNNGSCNYDFYLTFHPRGLGDLVGQLWIDNKGVQRRVNAQATEGVAGHFGGNSSLSIPFYSNSDLGSSIHMYIRFLPQGTITGLIEILISDGGCVPLDPAVFIGYEPEVRRAYAYLRTEADEYELFLRITATGFIKIWYNYNGTVLTLESENENNERIMASTPATGNIRKTRNSLKIGSNNYPFFRHGNFHGYIDEVAVARCEFRN